MTEKSQLQVEAICNGSVIDHIPAGQGINILKRFEMLDTRAANRITVGFNLPSKALGAKDLIKIENKQLTQKQVNQLALLAPTATVNIIENFEVVQKYHPELPEKIEGVYKCPNNNCITNYEPAVVTSFFFLYSLAKIKRPKMTKSSSSISIRYNHGTCWFVRTSAENVPVMIGIRLLLRKCMHTQIQILFVLRYTNPKKIPRNTHVIICPMSIWGAESSV